MLGTLVFNSDVLPNLLNAIHVPVMVLCIEDLKLVRCFLLSHRTQGIIGVRQTNSLIWQQELKIPDFSQKKFIEMYNMQQVFGNL